MNAAPARPGGGNGMAVVVGVLAVILGAGLWAVVTAVTAHELSLLAAGIGALIGLAMFTARPTSMGIAAVAALLTVIGCAVGEFFALPDYAAHAHGLRFASLVNLELHHPRVFFDSLGA